MRRVSFRDIVVWHFTLILVFLRIFDRTSLVIIFKGKAAKVKMVIKSTAEYKIEMIIVVLVLGLLGALYT